MYAETVYTVYNSLSLSEKQRFIEIIQLEINEKKDNCNTKNVKQSTVKSKEEYLDIALKNMIRNRKSP